MIRELHREVVEGADMRTRAPSVYVAPDDPLSMILEAVVRLVWLVVRGVSSSRCGPLLATCPRSPWRLSWRPADWWLGVRIGLAAGYWCVLIAAALVVAALVYRESFSRLAAPRLILLWRDAAVPDALAPGGAAVRSRGPAPRCVRTATAESQDLVPRLLRVSRRPLRPGPAAPATSGRDDTR